MIIIGVDPGLTGAVCFLDAANDAARIADMPVHAVTRGNKHKHEIDAAGLVQLLHPVKIGHAFVEQVGAMPGQGTSSMFSLGRTYGTILGALAALGVPVTRVTPQAWKKHWQLGASKDDARRRASELLPQHAFYWPLVKHHGRAEAALIALYGNGYLKRIAGGA